MFPSPALAGARSSALHQTPAYIRGFSVSSRALASNAVPPESPSYIRLPSNPEPDENKPIRVRGHLPVPRKIPLHDASPQERAAFIQNTTPKSTKPIDPDNATQKWKAQMADARRTNLKGGLKALWERHGRKEDLKNQRLLRDKKEREQALKAPERDDDVFTRGTVLKSLLNVEVGPDPERFARAEKSRANVLGRDEAKRGARRDALIKMYMGATNFIVQESDLQAEIDNVFADDYWTKQRNIRAENAWGLYGKPISTNEMLSPSIPLAYGLTERQMDEDQEHQRTGVLQKRIAEELTGGKMV
jgi:hypothetical protein